MVTLRSTHLEDSVPLIQIKSFLFYLKWVKSVLGVHESLLSGFTYIRTSTLVKPLKLAFYKISLAFFKRNSGREYYHRQIWCRNNWKLLAILYITAFKMWHRIYITTRHLLHSTYPLILVRTHFFLYIEKCCWIGPVGKGTKHYIFSLNAFCIGLSRRRSTY